MFSLEQLDQLMESEASPRHVIGDAPQTLIRTQEYRVSRSVRRIAQFVRKITDTSDPLFTLSPRPTFPRVRSSLLGDRLQEAVCKDLREFQEYFPCHAYNPYIELLSKAIDANPNILNAFLDLKRARGEEAQEIFRVATHFVEWLRQAAATKEFLAELDARRRQCQKNDASAAKYIDEIFTYRASKNLAVRIDLVVGCEDPDRRGITSTVDAHEARHQFDRFIRHIRKNFPLTGWLCTFEYGSLTGYHFHLLLFFDGHKQWNGEALGYLLGEFWKNKITEGRGRYFNCNAVDYAMNGIGMIWHDDVSKRELLMRNVVSYLTKTDFWLKFEGTHRTFFRGQMLTQEEKDEMGKSGGRPRRQSLPDLEAEAV
ncbi:inovirus-type Gp2 protein [Variovorax paradoxus]|uniref:inovirus-type Gp2 protein n=1 Tax=Variovorax paradoxus TaxID=34073 RepID=UPI0019331FF1|nr:inovirus-type Gp2 protein [Variovorax paradoxus]